MVRRSHEEDAGSCRAFSFERRKKEEKKREQSSRIKERKINCVYFLDFRNNNTDISKSVLKHSMSTMNPE